MDIEKLEVISNKLDIIVKLMAIDFAEGRPNKESIIGLSDAGLDRHTIANILGTTPLTVSVTVSGNKKKKKNEKAKKTKIKK